MKKLQKNILTFCLFGLLCSRVGQADDRTMSFNHEVKVLPAPGVVVIDGKTDDWDLSAGIWSYNDPTIVERFSVWTHMMWDDKGVYFLAHVYDPSPMQNGASSKDFSSSWRADCFQGRVIFDDGSDQEHQMHLNMYYSTPDEQAYMIVKHGGFRSEAPYDQTGPNRPDLLQKFGNTMEEHGGGILIGPWEDGKGYNMEAFWPWSYLRLNGQPLKPGEHFTFGLETMWGNRDGTKLMHRLADGITDETVNRIFMFRARKGWGRAVLSDKGNLDITAKEKELQAIRLKRFVDYDTYGSIPIGYELPADREVTIAIDDDNGNRVRNLFGQYPRKAGDNSDLWDGLDDAGNPVKAGNYHVTVLHHEPIEIELFNSLYSSAIPPWDTENGRLLWGSNHGHPTSTATRGDVNILYFTGTEGGSGIQRIDANGIILWADGEEFLDGTLDDEYVYGISRSSWEKRVMLVRYQVKDGKQIPFDDKDKTPSPTLDSNPNISLHTTLAQTPEYLWACYPNKGSIQLINKKTGAVEKEIPAGEIVALTDRNDRLFALTKGGAICEYKQGKWEILLTVQGLKNPQRLSVDHSVSRFAISDTGSNQVVVADTTGKILYKIGSAYPGIDRPAGPFVNTDLIQPMGTGFDAQGRLWVPEGTKNCKRVGLWSAEGTLLDQFWGQADYGAMAGFPIVNDSTRFIAHGIEFKLDPDPDPWTRKTNEKPLIYHPELAHVRGMVYEVNGQEFACALPGYNRGKDVWIYRRDSKGVFVPAVHIIPKRRDSGGTAWVDLNGDGRQSDDEVTTDLDWTVLYWSNGWARPDLALMSPNGLFFPLKSISPQGVPLYDFANPEKVPNWPNFSRAANSNGTPIMDMKGNVSNGIRYRTIDGKTGVYPNLYGRHDAPAAQPGVLIAPFRTNGVVEDIPGIGSLVALGGDRGEWFLLSMDGLYVSSISQDIKGNVTLDETFIGGESFGGFLWRDGLTDKVLIQLGAPSYRIMEVKGLESSVREEVMLTVTTEEVRQGVKIAQDRQRTESTEPEMLKIARVRRAPDTAAPVAQSSSSPLIPGSLDTQVSEAGNAAVGFRVAMAKEGNDLVVSWQVSDPSPWKNGEGRYTHAFIGGDAVDLKLDVPGRGPIRLLVAPIGGQATAVYSQVKSDTPRNPTTYVVENNPANAMVMDVVEVLNSAKIDVNVGFNSYTVLLRIPLKDLGLDPKFEGELRGILGVIYSDPAGINRAARLYWHDKKTGMVSDVPTEARLYPDRWGPIEVAK